MMPSQSAFDALGRALYEPDPAVRDEACRTLPALVPAAVEFLAGFTEGNTSFKELLGQLLGVIRGQQADVSSMTMHFVTRVPPAAIVPLIVLLCHENTMLRARVAQLLGKARDLRALEPFARLLGDPDGAVRAECARGLAGFGVGAEAPLPAVTPERHWQAVLFLAGAKCESAVEPLVAGLKGTPEQRRQAVAALAQFAAAAAPALCEALGDGDAEVRAAAARALRGVRQPDFRAALLGALRDESEAVRAAAAAALGKDETTPALQDWGTSCQIDPAVRAALIAALSDAAACVREAAAAALGELNDRAAVPPLCATLRDEDEQVRVAAIRALGQFRYQAMAAPAELLAALRDPAPACRKAAIVSLSHLQDRRAAAALLKATRDTSSQIREMALLAVGGLKKGHDPWEGYVAYMLAEEPPHPSPPAADAVSFSLVSPARFAPGQSAILTVWAHLPRQHAEVLALARQAFGASDFLVSQKRGARVQRGTRLTVRLSLPGFGIDDPEDEFFWDGDVGNATFPVAIPEGTWPGTYPGTVTVHVDAIRIAKLHFVAEVGEQPGPLTPLPVRPERCRTAFASYASEDRPEVLARVQGMQKAARDLDVFLDVHSLRSGDNWEKRLTEEIAARDVFYLFWSAAASRSPWVEREWRLALGLRGPDYIDPVPLAPPDQVPPPRELGDHLHFNDWVLAYLRGAQSRD
jgi:HEAT repeat protein